MRPDGRNGFNTIWWSAFLSDFVKFSASACEQSWITKRGFQMQKKRSKTKQSPLRPDRAAYEYEILRKNIAVIGEELNPRGLEILAELLMTNFLRTMEIKRAARRHDDPYPLDCSLPRLIQRPTHAFCDEHGEWSDIHVDAGAVECAQIWIAIFDAKITIQWITARSQHRVHQKARHATVAVRVWMSDAEQPMSRTARTPGSRHITRCRHTPSAQPPKAAEVKHFWPNSIGSSFPIKTFDDIARHCVTTLNIIVARNVHAGQGRRAEFFYGFKN